ncbi:MAG: phosphotransferase, partial [Actinomycetota bacterium]|nr:phosphotransferase [Actinomycetota bacterium]
MHENDVVADVNLVRRLLAQQFPEWAALALRPLPPTGTDNIIYRLGEELVVRMPRIDWATDQVARDHQWLPRIALQLPCRIPKPVAVGAPGLGYPFPWAVHAWIPGTNPEPGDHPALAADLAAFVIALTRLKEGPDSSRSGPLSTRDDAVRSALAEVRDEVDATRAVRLWEWAVSAPEHEGAPVWRHADL